jgi:hypothetical protein
LSEPVRAPSDAAGAGHRPRTDNYLADKLDHFVERAAADPAARIYAFGQRWGPEASIRDKVFGFLPGNGVHDIHMNLGNSQQFRGDDGVWQDGGLLLRYPTQDQWVAIFLAFQSQAWHTDDRTGHAIPTPEPGEPDHTARIVAALVNPAGPAPEAETVTLVNASPQSHRSGRLVDPGSGEAPAGPGRWLVGGRGHDPDPAQSPGRVGQPG